MKQKRVRLVKVSIVALMALMPQIVWAGNYRAGPLVRVSGTSPFGPTGCGLANQSGTVFVNSEVEPWIDVNPADPDNIVGTWQQDRWSNGGARGNVAGVSFDGGQTFALSPVTGTSECTGNPQYERASDPWLSFSPDGSLHHVSLSFNDSNFANAILVNKSEDGGLTWSAPKTIRRDTKASTFNDKESLTADPNSSRFVYVVWDRLVFPPGEPPNPAAAFNTAAFKGPAWFSRSTDGGETYERARPIFDPGTLNQTIGNQIEVLPNNARFDGELINIFNLIRNVGDPARRGFNVAIIRSPNRGRTWSDEIIVNKLLTIGVTDPDTGDPIRTGDLLPEIAVDADTGRLYAVWQDARFDDGRHDSVALSTSANGGLTWSRPVKVNRTPTNIRTGNQQAFTPSVDVADDGTVAVTYYDFRNNTSNPDTLPTDYFVVHCHAGTSNCSKRANYRNEIRLTNRPFDMRDTPFARGFFVGDYEGLANQGRDFTTFFSQSHGSDPASAFFRRVGP